jgi:hypothetical protein
VCGHIEKQDQRDGCAPPLSVVLHKTGNRSNIHVWRRLSGELIALRPSLHKTALNVRRTTMLLLSPHPPKCSQVLPSVLSAFDVLSHPSANVSAIKSGSPKSAIKSKKVDEDQIITFISFRDKIFTRWS